MPLSAVRLRAARRRIVFESLESIDVLDRALLAGLDRTAEQRCSRGARYSRTAPVKVSPKI